MMMSYDIIISGKPAVHTGLIVIILTIRCNRGHLIWNILTFLTFLALVVCQSLLLTPAHTHTHTHTHTNKLFLSQFGGSTEYGSLSTATIRCTGV